MAIELYDLYKEIYSDYDVKLLTTSCFNKSIDWMHTIENDEFAYLLHGGELIFNSNLNFETDEVRKRYIDKFIQMDAGGLIIALEAGNSISQELIDHCNKKKFPLFVSNWETSFLEITRKFSTILLMNERNETNLIAALKNAIHSPLDEAMYQSCFERNLFFRDMTYIVSILGNITDTNTAKLLKTSLQHSLKQGIVYEENDKLVLLTCGYQPQHLLETFHLLKSKEPYLYAAIGSANPGHDKIAISYKHAQIAYNLIGKAFEKPFLCYNDLDIYQLLSDISTPDLWMDFYQNTLGKLKDFDRENKTSHMEILKIFFENECHLANTAEAMFFHKNTLKYKLAKIREILGYDILLNENRMKIILALHIQKMYDTLIS